MPAFWELSGEGAWVLHLSVYRLNDVLNRHCIHNSAPMYHRADRVPLAYPFHSFTRMGEEQPPAAWVRGGNPRCHFCLSCLKSAILILALIHSTFIGTCSSNSWVCLEFCNTNQCIFWFLPLLTWVSTFSSSLCQLSFMHLLSIFQNFIAVSLSFVAFALLVYA